MSDNSKVDALLDAVEKYHCNCDAMRGYCCSIHRDMREVREALKNERDQCAKELRLYGEGK